MISSCSRSCREEEGYHTQGDAPKFFLRALQKCQRLSESLRTRCLLGNGQESAEKFLEPLLCMLPLLPPCKAGIDWRLGADHFESLLLDYDVASNWGNWNSAAALTGGRMNRFNILKQAKEQNNGIALPVAAKIITKLSLYKAHSFACSLANRDIPVAATLQRKCSGEILLQ